MKVNYSIIKIIGLLGESDKKRANKFYNTLQQNHFVQDFFPVKDDGKEDIDGEKFLKDYFYPDFRSLMFISSDRSENKRFISNELKQIGLIYKRGEFEKTYKIQIIKSEIYIFEGNLGLFSLSILPSDENYSIKDVSDILSIVRNFDTNTSDSILLHQWISQNILCGLKLRGENVKSDEYSGSKFKLFTVLDIDNIENKRPDLLYDIATTSPLGSAAGNEFYSPDPEYYTELMNNRIGVFKNWEALCLFDSFTCVGNGQLLNPQKPNDNGLYKTWDYTYFRIYLFRLFFKFNIYRYNSEVQKNNDNPETLRNNFESFLNKYHVSHISFNFLANDIFKKTGNSLELEEELANFRERINNLSDTIKEEKQSKTNLLLEAVTVLSGLSSIGPVFDILSQVKIYLAWSSYMFYFILSVILLLIAFGIIYFLMPEKIKKIWKSIKSTTR